MSGRGSTIIAYHLVWSTYGAWLPNDPRGSGSRETRGKSLSRLGQIHYGRRREQPSADQLRQFQSLAAERLVHPVVRLGPLERDAVGAGFQAAIRDLRLTCFACAIMPDHVHLILRRHKLRAEEMIENLKGSARDRVRHLRPRMSGHPLWTDGSWKGFLNSQAAVRAAVRYCERNPAAEGLPVQAWPFVVIYDGWPRQGRSLSAED